MQSMIQGDTNNCKGLQASQNSQDDTKLTTTFYNCNAITLTGNLQTMYMYIMCRI